MSARPGKVEVFQFGGRAIHGNGNSNYFEISDNSSVPYDPEVETEFSRLRDNGTFDRFEVTNQVARKSSKTKPDNYLEAEDEISLFYEDFMKMTAKQRRRSKSLD